MNRKFTIYMSTVFTLLVGLSSLAMTSYHTPRENIGTNQYKRGTLTTELSSPPDPSAQMAFLEPSNKLFEVAAKSLENNLPLDAANTLQSGLNLFTNSFANSKMPDELTKAVDDLQAVITQVKSGQVNSVEELQISLSKFNLSLADYYLFQAEENWQQTSTPLIGYDMEFVAESYEQNHQEKVVATGYNLELAAESFENALKWQPSMDASLIQMIDAGSPLSADLVLGKGYQTASVSQYLAHLSDALVSIQTASGFTSE